jgi:transposase
VNVVQTTSTSKSGKVYHATLLRESYREDGKVKNRTIANISHCKPEEIQAIRLALKHKGDLASLGSFEESVELKQGLSFGAVWAVYAVARELSIEAALGRERDGKLALWQVIARVIEQGSRLSATRLAQTNAGCDILGLRQGFDENALYDNLEWLSSNQEEIEKKLLRLRRKGSAPELFLYDVTSSYLEGECHELGDWGYNRDKKRGKKQLVVGLLCDELGSPISVEVFAGNTSDLQTFSSQVKKASEKYGCQRVTFVGDRGMIKSGQIEDLQKVGFNYITAITKPQIRGLIREGKFQLSLFDEKLCEVIADEVRYLLRRNPLRAAQMKLNREQRLAAVSATAEKINVYLKESPKASLKIASENLKKKIDKLKLGKLLSISIDVNARLLSLLQDQGALARESELDGCYALKTDLPADALGPDLVHERYKDLGKVEQAFRTSKTGLLELRPWFVRTDESTRGHALVVMLAYLVVQKLQTAWAELNVTVEEGLAQLSSLCSIEIVLKDGISFHQIPTPTEMSSKLLEALGIKLPKALPHLGAKVVTRKKLKRST